MILKYILSLILFSFVAFNYVRISIQFSYFKNYKRALKYGLTPDQVLGYVVLIAGKKGSGKTSFMNCCSQFALANFDSTMFQRMNEILLSIPSFDFTVCNSFVDGIVYSKVKKNLELDLPTLKSSIFSFVKNFKFDSYYTDYISLSDKSRLVYDYCVYYLCMNYPFVYLNSNFNQFDVTHSSYSNYFDISSLELKNCLLKRDYQAISPAVMCYDEASHFFGNDKSSDKDLKASGSGTFLSLVRNGGKNLLRVYLSVQDKDDLVKKFRGQVDTIVKIDKFNVNYFLKGYSNLISLIQFVDGLYHRKIIYDCNTVRNNKSFWFKFSKYCESKAYVKIIVKCFDSETDVESNCYKKNIFYCPLCYFWGTFDTNQYAPVFDYFEQNFSCNRMTSHTSVHSDVALKEFINKIKD